ncbi:MAG: hypothetical protein IJR68_01475 [Fretibacterium sp.]|nr:hypothetical protein [Fretibacterium sp.]
MAFDETKVTRLKHLVQNAQAAKNAIDALQAAMPTKVSDLTNDSNFQTQTQVEEAISAAVSGALQPAGSIAFAALPALAKANCNKIYNITDAFTTTADFVEGASKSYPAGTNVAIINVGTAQTPSYKYDTYTGTFDFSGFAEKVSSATSGNFAGLDANGNLTDSGSKAADFVAAESGKRLMTDAEGTKLAGISTEANKTTVTTEASGAIEIDGVSKTVVAFATDTEVTEALNGVWNPSAGGSD